MKKFMCTPLFFTTLIASQFEVAPIGDLQLRYNTKSLEYTSLGEAVLGTNKVDFNDYVFGGEIGVNTKYENYNLNIGYHTIQRVHNKDENHLKNEKTWYDENLNEVNYLGTFNLTYTNQNTLFTFGRQEYSGKLVDGNQRITQNSFEGMRVEYKQDDTKIDGFYFNKIASSTIANTVPKNHRYGFLGYGLGYSVGEYANISEHILNKDKSTNGAFNLIFQKGQDSQNIMIENLFVDNFFNTTNLIGTYTFAPFQGKVGVIYQTSVGKDYVEQKYNQNLESRLVQGEIKYTDGKFFVVYRASQTASNRDNVYDGTLFSPFSNKPAWVIGLQTAHGFLADTLAQELLVVNTFYIDKLPITLAGAYLQYAVGEDNGLENSSFDVSEKFLRAKFYLSKKLTSTFEYSVAKNIDIVTASSKNGRVVLEYTF